MTTIVAVKAGNRIAIAADTRACWGEDTFPGAKVSKLTPLPDGGAIGFAGSSITVQTFRAFAAAADRTDLKFGNELEVMNTFIRFWKWGRVHGTMVKDAPGDAEGVSAQIDGHAVVASPAGIFSVGWDMSVYEHTAYCAIGSGADYALGALHQMEFFDSTATARNKAERAIETAAVFNLATGGPVESRDMSCWADGSASSLADKSDKELWDKAGDHGPQQARGDKAYR